MQTESGSEDLRRSKKKSPKARTDLMELKENNSAESGNHRLRESY
jgi:hypothetical protein